MVTVADLREDFNANASDDQALERALALAEALVSEAFANAWREVPAPVTDECIRRAAWNIFKGRATGDAGTFLGADGSTGVVGVANDPLRKCWPLIKRYTRRL